MKYEEFFKEARGQVEKERRAYAIDKLVNLMRDENEIINRANRCKVELENIRTNISELGTHEVGFPGHRWIEANRIKLTP